MKKETREVWVTDDGSVFDKEADAETHDRELRKREKSLSALKVFSVSHGFDVTEGKGYSARTLVITDQNQSVVLQWCFDKFGEILQGWYQGRFYEAWHLNLTEFTVKDAMERKGLAPYSYHQPTKIVVVSSNDFTWAGLPKSEFPWPRPKKE